MFLGKYTFSSAEMVDEESSKNKKGEISHPWDVSPILWIPETRLKAIVGPRIQRIWDLDGPVLIGKVLLVMGSPPEFQLLWNKKLHNGVTADNH